MSDSALAISKKRANKALAGAIILVGIDYGTFAILSIFIAGLCEKLNTGLTEVAFMFTVTYAITLVVGMAAAAFIEKASPRLLCILGSLCYIAYFLCMAFCPNLTVLYIGAALFGASNCLAGYTVLQPVVSWWHAKDLGKKMSYLTIAAGVGAMILSPAATLLMRAVGFEAALIIIGVVLGVLMIVATVLLISDKPERYGLLPYGYEEGAADGEGEAGDPNAGVSFRKSMGNVYCLMIMVAMLIGAIAVTGFVNNEAYIYATYGLSETGAATMISVYSFASIIWTFAYGWICDKIGAGKGSAIFGILSIVAFLAAAFLPGMPGALSLAIMVGCAATYAMLGAVLLGSMFGPKASGTLIVISNVFASVGGMAGPLLASGVFEGSGSYKGFMLIAAAIYVVYTLFVYFATNKPAMAKLRAMWE